MDRPYIPGMPSSPRTPRNTVGSKRRLPKVGDELIVRVRVTRTGRNSYDTADTVTLRLPGFETPVTVSADSLLEAIAED